ncbi:hypothetical protein [Nannocystis punicea]|uniref:Uncharacterized protein n=1 Tax=Nannocystis punicea TaxID=2995304 RepID=A0ABY7HEV0_9BACT|nr:hypothetical protein [Nannocystis poenicansa]WAS97622.1 hypothetical protein O0S08_15875 [Nannocystis poenicansa]
MAGLRDRLSTAWNTLLPLALALLIVGPSLPNAALGEVPSTLAQWQKKISVVQTWNMYAPDPTRAHTYLAVYAEFQDGRREALVEAEQAQSGWGTTWAWRKTRVDIWRYYAVLNPDKPNNNRLWYLRSLCVREALAREEPPRKIVAERVRRRFTPPDRVLAGKPGLGPVDRKPLATVDCKTWPVRDMLADARARHG